MLPEGHRAAGDGSSGPEFQGRGKSSGGGAQIIVPQRHHDILRLHTHPDTGSEFWLQRIQRHGLTWEEVVACPGDVPAVTVAELRKCDLGCLLPRPMLAKRPFLVTGETSGFSGQPVVTFFSEQEFRAGFVTPFIKQAERTGFPLRTTWLWAGPTGPHIVGKALREIVRTVGGVDPFAVDFDPRWFRRQAAGSLSARRYFEHVLRQLHDILEHQSVEVLYGTPPVIKALADGLGSSRRSEIRGVHYAGMAMSYEEYCGLRGAFPNAVHISGYGNSLFGMFPETGFSPDGIEYCTASERLEVRVLREEEEFHGALCSIGERGRLSVSRYDESVLILNMKLDDRAVRTHAGILDPHRPLREYAGRLLY